MRGNSVKVVCKLGTHLEIIVFYQPEAKNTTSVCAQLAATNGSLEDIVEEDIATMQIWIQV